MHVTQLLILLRVKISLKLEKLLSLANIAFFIAQVHVCLLIEVISTLLVCTTRLTQMQLSGGFRSNYLYSNY